MKKRKQNGLLVTLLASAVFLVSAGATQAAVINVDAINSGHYTAGGGANGNTNNINSVSPSQPNWLGFDLSSIADPILSATLEVDSDRRNASGQSYSWREVTSSYGLLGTTSAAVLADLLSGPVFASGTHMAGIINSFVMNAAGLVSLNASPGNWAIAGNNSQANPAFGYTGGVSSGDHIRLVLTTGDVAVPEPTTTALLAIGLLGAAFAKKRRTH